MFRTVALARTCVAVASRTATRSVTVTPRVNFNVNASRINTRNFAWFGKDEEKKEEEKPATEADAKADTTTEEPATTEEPVPQKDEKDLKIEKLEEELKNLKDQLIRTLADSENTRRIAAKDVENAKLYANTSFAKAMIEIADDLERALANVPEEEKKVLFEGIKLVEKNLFKSLGKFGVQPYGQANDKFDPNLHDALFRIPDTENESGTIGQVVKKGYMIKDRVLRAAQVGARYNPEKE